MDILLKPKIYCLGMLGVEIKLKSALEKGETFDILITPSGSSSSLALRENGYGNAQVVEW